MRRRLVRTHSSPHFWIFWAYHLIILLTVVEITVIQRFRPTWNDLKRALAFTVVYAAVLVVPNNLFGWNFLLGVNDSFIISKDKNMRRVPEPFVPTALLLGLGCTLLGILGRKTGSKA